MFFSKNLIRAISIALLLFVTASGIENTTNEYKFASLKEARDAVRNKIKEGLKEDITVYVEGGIYYLSEPITFEPGDSGTEKYSITYKNESGKQVEIRGGMKLSGFKRYNDTIWQIDMPQGVEPKQVFENGVRLEMARMPDTGYLRVEKPVKGKEKSAIIYKQGDLPNRQWDLENARLMIWPWEDWHCDESRIAAVDADARTIELKDQSRRQFLPGNRYYIKNDLSVLDKPGEYQIDYVKRKIYIWPQKEPIQQQEIVISTVDEILAVEGSVDNPVTNLHFEGIDLNISNGDCAVFTNAEKCSVKNSKIENAYNTGIMLKGHCQQIQLSGNLIGHHGQEGVELTGGAIGEPYINHHNTVANNHVFRCGWVHRDGNGIGIRNSGDNTVIHNLIHNMPRKGIRFSSLRYQVLKNRVEGVTWENHWDFQHTRNNFIAYNHIYHTNLDSQDTGAIGSWGAGKNNVIHNNLIHDTGNKELKLQSGIYLDDQTDYATVTSNIIYNVVGPVDNHCIFTKGIGNIIHNNILIVSEDCNSAIASLYMVDERCDHHHYSNNIIYFDPKSNREQDSRSVYHFMNWTKDRVVYCDKNVYYKAGGGLSISGYDTVFNWMKFNADWITYKGAENEQPEYHKPSTFKEALGIERGADTWKGWLSAFGGKYDKRSIEADPQFVDAENRNFRLRQSSPAFKTGFIPIDSDKVGLTSDFPDRFEKK